MKTIDRSYIGSSPKFSAGFGMIEVMIAMSLMLIVAMGMSSLISSMQKEQKKLQLMATLGQLKSQMTSMITNETAWAKSVGASADNPNMACLRNAAGCTGFVAASYSISSDRIVLKDTSGATFYDGRASTTQGFTEGGQSCTTFSANSSSGNDDCPIGYVINWSASTLTSNPQLLVNARLIFNPSNAHYLKNFFNADGTKLLPSKYDVEIRRTATTMSKAFSIRVAGPTGAGNTCATQGFGTCATPPAWTSYGSGGAGLYSITADQHSLVNLSVTPGAIHLNKAGFYKCTVVTFGYGVNSVKMQLIQTSPSVSLVGTVSSFASAANYGYTALTLDTIINASVDGSEYMIQQQCGVVPSGGGAYDSCALGFNTTESYYGANGGGTSATMNCVLTE